MPSLHRQNSFTFFLPMQSVHNLTIINFLQPSGYYMYHQVYDLKILHYVQTFIYVLGMNSE
jgi:hypothetical protein